MSNVILPRQERTEPSGHRPCRHGVKSSLRREPDAPGELLRAIFGNVTGPRRRHCHLGEFYLSIVPVCRRPFGTQSTAYAGAHSPKTTLKSVILGPRDNAAVTQQKTLKMLTRSRRHLPDDAAQPDQIAHGFMIGVRHPDRRQLSGPMKTGEHGRVTTICLHPIARLRGDQRRRHHVAPMAEACELAINAIAARSGLITKRQRLAGTPKTAAELAGATRFIGNLAKVFHRSRAPALRHRDRDPFFVNIQANKSGSMGARLLCVRLCAGYPAQPSYRHRMTGHPQAQQS